MKGKKKQGYNLGYNFLKPVKLGATGFQSFGNIGMKRPIMQDKQMKIKIKPLVDMRGMHAYDLMGKRPEKKKLNYKQSYQFFNLRPFGDIDRDGVPNWRDCKPYDPLRQGKHWDTFKEKVGGVTEKVGKAFGREPKEEEWEPGGADLTSTRRQGEVGIDESTKNWHHQQDYDEYLSPTGIFPQTPTGEWPESQPEKEETALVPYGETGIEPVEGDFESPVDKELPEWVASDDEDFEEPIDIESESKSDDAIEKLMDQYVPGEQSEEQPTEKKPEKKVILEKQEEEDGSWNVYVRFHKTKWDQYTKTADKKDAMKMINFLRHTKGVVDARASPRDILKKLNSQLTREQFIGAIKDRGWGENIRESAKLDEKAVKEAKKWGKRYARGPATNKQMDKYLRALDSRSSEPKYRASMYRPESRSSGSRSTKTSGLGGNVGLGGGSPKGSWWNNVKAQGQQQSHNIYAMGNQSRQANQARTVPPNAMGTGREQRYNPVTAGQSFIKRPSVRAPWQQQQQGQQGFQVMEEEYQQGFQPQQNVEFSDRPRGLGLTGGQRTLTGTNRRM